MDYQIIQIVEWTIQIIDRSIHMVDLTFQLIHSTIRIVVYKLVFHLVLFYTPISSEKPIRQHTIGFGFIPFSRMEVLPINNVTDGCMSQTIVRMPGRTGLSATLQEEFMLLLRWAYRCWTQ